MDRECSLNETVNREKENSIIKSFAAGRWAKVYPYGIIAGVVFLFNMIAIWGPKFLLEDDGLTYYYAVQNIFPYPLIKHGSILAAFTEWGAWNMMAAFSPQLVRLIYVLIYMIPVSWLFFRLLHRYQGIPVGLAITIAVLPAALPAQWQIPAFLNGSYVIPTLLLFLAALITGFRYLEAEPGHKNRWLLSSLLLYLAATQWGDNAVFLFPAMILAIILYRRFNRQTVVLVAGHSVVFLVKTLWIYFSPRPAAEILLLGQAKIINRMRFYFLSMLPFPHNSPAKYVLPVAIIVFIVIIAGFVFLYLRKPLVGFSSSVYGHLGCKSRVLFVYGFFFLWTTASIAAFIFFSRWQGERYSYIAAYGFNAIALISLHAILKQVLRERRKIILILLFGLVVFSGTARFFELKKIYRQFDSQQSIMRENLKDIRGVANAQVMIYVPKGWSNFWTHYEQNSGLLKYIMNKKDVSGLFTDDESYYTLYSPKRYVTCISRKMRALDWKRPLFFYACSYGGCKQFEYVVKWKFIKKELRWKIHKMGKYTGTKTFLAGGKGLDGYKVAVKNLRERNIITGTLLWGDPLATPPSSDIPDCLLFSPLIFR